MYKRQVLSFVSQPNFDPNLFVDGIDVDNWKALNDSIDRPLINRPIRGVYPPGSTFKPFVALAGLEHGLRAPPYACLLYTSSAAFACASDLASSNAI